MLRVVLLLCLTVCANADYVTRKFCKDLDQSQCSVHNVRVEPCAEGPGFCSIRRNKNYGLDVDFTPRFSANKLKLAMFADEENADNYSTSVKVPQEFCEASGCTFENGVRRNLGFDFKLDKRVSGKFPIKVKLWNEENEAQACCFTFNVKTKK